MTTSIATLQKRVTTLQRTYTKKFGNLVILSDGETCISSRTGRELSNADIEKLRKRYRLIWRMYPPGLIDNV